MTYCFNGIKQLPYPRLTYYPSAPNFNERLIKTSGGIQFKIFAKSYPLCPCLKWNRFTIFTDIQWLCGNVEHITYNAAMLQHRAWHTTLIQSKPWCREGAKPLPEPMMIDCSHLMCQLFRRNINMYLHFMSFIPMTWHRKLKFFLK